jgi:Uma2 family endonuclease
MGTPATGQKEALSSEKNWPPAQGQWTIEDWLKLPDDRYRYEVIDGVLHMSPPPRARHQRILARLVANLMEFLKSESPGELLFVPIGVRLPNQTVPVKPDILFIKAERLDIIGEDYVEGAPDLIMEVLSPGNWLYDRREKMQLYQAAGIDEYWIVDPRTDTIEVYLLEQGTYLLLGEYGLGELAQSRVIPGFEVATDDVFPA